MVESKNNKSRMEANKQGNAIFLTKLGDDPSDTESVMSYRQEEELNTGFLPPIGR